MTGIKPPPMSWLRLFAVLALALAASPLAAHEPGEAGRDQSAGFGEPGDATAPSRTVDIAMQEGHGSMRFSPDVVTVTKGEQIRFHLINEGELDHEFVLGTAAEIAEHAEMMRAMPDMVHVEPNAMRLAPKAAADIVWRFTRAGEFEFACLIPGHLEAGMKGRIVVK